MHRTLKEGEALTIPPDAVRVRVVAVRRGEVRVEFEHRERSSKCRCDRQWPGLYCPVCGGAGKLLDTPQPIR